MSYSLVIVESPAKCTKIEKFLGAGYKVIGSYGHITHLSNLNQIDFLSFSDLELDQIEDLLQGVIDNIKDERAERNYITDRASDKLFFGV